MGSKTSSSDSGNDSTTPTENIDLADHIWLEPNQIPLIDSSKLDPKSLHVVELTSYDRLAYWLRQLCVVLKQELEVDLLAFTRLHPSLAMSWPGQIRVARCWTGTDKVWT